VEIGSGIAPGYCGKLLADQGADVVRLEPRGSDPLRRWRASDPDRPTPETGALFHYLNTSKRSAALDATEVTELTAGWADLVVTAEDSPVETDGCVVSIS